MTTQDGGPRPADIETNDPEVTDATDTVSEQDVDVEVAYGADVRAGSMDNENAGRDDADAAALAEGRATPPGGEA